MKNLKVNILALLLIVTGLVVCFPPFQKRVQSQTVAQSNGVTSASQREAIAHIDKAYELAQSMKYSSSMPSIASAYAKAGQFDKALAVANRISDNSERQSEALVDIASAYTKAGQLAKADGVLRQAIAVTNRISPLGNQRWLMSRIVSVYAEARQFDKALAIANRISRNNGNGFSIAMSFITIAYAKAGQFDKALALINLADDKERTQGDIATAYAKAGQFDKAVALANSISDSFWQTQATVNIATAYAEVGQFDKALAFANRIPDGEVWSIAAAYVDVGNDVQSAVELIYPDGHLDGEDMELLLFLHLQRAEKILEN